MGQRRVNRMARLLEDQRWGGIRTTAAVIKLREEQPLGRRSPQGRSSLEARDSCDDQGITPNRRGPVTASGLSGGEAMEGTASGH
jgi:hypothetical protein